MRKVNNLEMAYQEYVQTRKGLIAKIKPFIKKGHVPHRGKMPYSLCFEQINKNNNCFEHSCFNFTNPELFGLDVTYAESLIFGGHLAWAMAETKDEMECEIEQFLEDCGLDFQECQPDAILKNNQWKVALFLAPDWEKSKGYHFLLQEKDGSWSAKDGFINSVSFFEDLTDRVKSNGDVYDFHKTYAITNPYAKEK